MSPSCGSHLTASTTESNQWMLLRVPVGAALQWLICSIPPGGTWTNPAPTTSPVSLRDLQKATQGSWTSLKLSCENFLWYPLNHGGMNSYAMHCWKTQCLWLFEANHCVRENAVIIAKQISLVSPRRGLFYNNDFSLSSILCTWLLIKYL